jgi:hypothetical protein
MGIRIMTKHEKKDFRYENLNSPSSLKELYPNLMSKEEVMDEIFEYITTIPNTYSGIEGSDRVLLTELLELLFWKGERTSNETFVEKLRQLDFDV